MLYAISGSVTGSYDEGTLRGFTDKLYSMFNKECGWSDSYCIQLKKDFNILNNLNT